jgi:oligopeptidase B
MNSSRLLVLAIAPILLTGCRSNDDRPEDIGVVEASATIAPVAARQPVELEKHGDVRVDEYYWLRERENPEVIAYLEAENSYREKLMAHTKTLRKELFEEIKGRIKQDDESVPYLFDYYYYYTRYEEGSQYPIHCRKKGSTTAAEEILLDVDQLSEGEGYLSVRGLNVSTSRSLLAYAIDRIGRRVYTIRIKNLVTGELLEDEIPGVTGNLAWANDNRTIFYARQDSETLRSYQIYRHTLGTEASEDQLVYEEADDTFSCYVAKSKSRQYMVISSQQTLSNEYRVLSAFEPEGDFQVVIPRERGHEYSLDHHGDHFYILSNDDAPNFRLMKTPVAKPDRATWEEVIPHRADVFLQDFEVFSDYLVVTERQKGLIQLQVRPWTGADSHYLEFDEAAYMARPMDNYDYDTHELRFAYSSMATPNSVFDYDMSTKRRQLLKQDEVLGDFDSENYRIERLHARARDGAEVPISLVYRKGTRRDGTSPLLLYAYGSYGSTIDPGFSSSRISLLDRGFVYAIAHVRGGQMLGRWWYDDGKLLKKKNTFTDFIDCADYLVKDRYTAPDRLFAMGGSAGGLLMGAVANMRPDLFNGIVAQVPWVDVVTTMLDDTIPLTTSEYDEWGNPEDKAYYDYMLSYSPYDQVEAKDYPNMLVTTGLHDSQVQYFEPAKWVAKLRAMKTDDNRLLLKINMEAGHGGASGRYKRYEEIAYVYAFLLDLVPAGT